MISRQSSSSDVHQLRVSADSSSLFAKQQPLHILESFSGFKQKRLWARPILKWHMNRCFNRASGQEIQDAFFFYTSLENEDFLSSSHKAALTEGGRQYQDPLCQSPIWNLFRGKNAFFPFVFCFRGLYFPSFHLLLSSLVPSTLG